MAQYTDRLADTNKSPFPSLPIVFRLLQDFQSRDLDYRSLDRSASSSVRPSAIVFDFSGFQTGKVISDGTLVLINRRRHV